MTKEVKTELQSIPTWGYTKDGAKIYDVQEGKKLPKGVYDSPAKVPSEKAKA